MNKFLLPLFVLLAAAIGFTSCSKDDDDSPVISISLNGNAVENGGKFVLAKPTAGAGNADDELVNLSIISDKEIKSIQISVKNDWEDNVAVCDVNGKCYNDKYTTSGTEKKVSFSGVIGEYTVKVVADGGSKTYKFNLTDKDGKTAYFGTMRNLCNVQTIIWDSKKETATNKVLNTVFKADSEANTNSFDGNVCQITETEYKEFSTDGSIKDFGTSAEKMTFNKGRNISNVPTYLVYKKDSDHYYLMLVESIEGSVLTAKVQY